MNPGLRCRHLFFCDPEQMFEQVADEQLRREHISGVPDGGEVQNQELEKDKEAGASVEHLRERGSNLGKANPTEKFNILQHFLYNDKYLVRKGRDKEGRQGNVGNIYEATHSPLHSQEYARNLGENYGNCGGEWKGITYNDVYNFHQRRDQRPLTYGGRVRTGKTDFGLMEEKALRQLGDRSPLRQTETAGSTGDGFSGPVVSQQRHDPPEPAPEESHDEFGLDYDYASDDHAHHRGAKEDEYDEEYDYTDFGGPDHDYTDVEERVFGSERFGMMRQYSVREGVPDEDKQRNRYIKSYVGGHIKTQEEEQIEE